jgi:hypothetical protein
LTAAFRKEIVNFRPNYTLNAYVVHPTIQKYKALSSDGNTNLLEEIQANSLNIAEQGNAVFEKARDLLQAVHKKISIHQYRNIINRIASNFARDTIPEAPSGTSTNGTGRNETKRAYAATVRTSKTYRTTATSETSTKRRGRKETKGAYDATVGT